MIPFTLEPLSEDALLVRFGDRIDATTNVRVHAAASAIRGAALDGITDIAPAYASILVRFDPRSWSPRAGEPALARISDTLRATLAATTHGATAGQASEAPDPTREIAVPVCYGGDFGPDLGAVAAHAKISVGEVIARHAAATYTVAMLGFAPGFPYLLGLDPSLDAPRRANPRVRVPRGSVAIGGAQTGIYPQALPGGWRLIGRTPLRLFEPRRDPPALLAPGDIVRFHAIDAAAFARMGADDEGHREAPAAQYPR